MKALHQFIYEYVFRDTIESGLEGMEIGKFIGGSTVSALDLLT